MQGAEFLNDPTNVIFAKLFVAILLGGIIGTERSVIAGQPAGTRTFGLVALGSCLLIVMSNYVDAPFVGILNFDPLRLAAGIVTGIGFLGAGIIIFRGNTVHGITTAAGIWVASAVGMAVGFGMYAVSIFATLLTLLMFTGMWYVENRFKHWFNIYNEDSTGGK